MAKKRSRQAHTGSVYQSGGQWYAAVMVHGRRRRIRCETKAEALQKRFELCQLAEANSSLVASTFGVFRLRWLETVKANKAANTHEAIKYALRHFEPLDQIPLEKVTGQSIQTVLNGLNGRSRQHAFDKCRQMLNMAVRWKCLLSNPMEHMDRPAHERGAIDPFEVGEVSMILEALKDCRYGAAVALAFCCGLRGGELWGLQWGDLKGNELTIQRQACEVSGKVEIKTTKTTNSIRRILIADSVLTEIHVRREESLREGNAAIAWMFPGLRGEVTRRSNFAHRVWNPLLKQLKLRQRGFHHARHTAATLLLNAGSVPLAVVSKILGHASPKITLQTYAHVMTADLEKHRNAFDVITRKLG
ncbi:MAG: site-specific integrase [Planctomyces sp.]|nr:site-specific integrase [Planctomyces sp.]